MSFTTKVSEELAALPPKKTCCRKALLLGLMMGGMEGESGEVTAFYQTESTGILARDLLQKLFRAETTLTPMIRAGRQTFALSSRAGGVLGFLKALDEGREPMIHQAAGFRCAACQTEFARGVFLGCGTLNDPHKGYHMELVLPTEERADALRKFLDTRIGRPGKIKRGNRFGLYYKSNGAITDFLYYIGGSGASFDVANVWIERDIRNNENRATNCVARNISRSVDASKKQREAIEGLYKTRRIDALSEELRATAELRLEYPDASLAELALLHQPPISKSGLNRRLTRLLEEYESLPKPEKFS